MFADFSCIKTMPNYKLTYFEMRGRGEIVRLVFAAAGVHYEDHRIDMSDWPAMKPSKLAVDSGLFIYLFIYLLLRQMAAIHIQNSNIHTTQLYKN